MVKSLGPNTNSASSLRLHAIGEREKLFLVLGSKPWGKWRQLAVTKAQMLKQFCHLYATCDVCRSVAEKHEIYEILLVIWSMTCILKQLITEIGTSP